MGATLAKLLDGLERRSTWRNAGLAVGGTVLSNLAMGGYILPNIQARRPQAMRDGFLVMIDLQPLSSSEEVYRVYDLYTPDILGFVRLLYALDFVMPLSFAVFILCLVGKLLRYLEVKGGWRAVLLLPFAALPFDYTENALSLFLIGQYQDGQVFPTLARVASIATVVKFLGLACAGLTVVVLLLRTAMKLVARRLALAVLLASACSSSSTDPAPAEPALADRFVRFVVKDFNWELGGYDVLVVSADGQASYVGAVSTFEQRDGQRVLVPVWHRVDWQADAGTVEALVRHLEGARFRQLEASYVDPDVHDGENVEYVLETRDGVKQVTFRNRAPAEVAELRSFVDARLVAPQRASLKAGTPLSPEEAAESWKRP